MSELIKRLRERAEDSGYHADFTAAADRIAELESSLADAIEAQQILGLKLAQAEAQTAKLYSYWADEEDAYSDPGDYQDYAGIDIGDTFELTKCYAERKPTKFRVISRGLDITGDQIIDVEEVDETKGHSSTALGGPTPVTDAAPACDLCDGGTNAPYFGLAPHKHESDGRTIFLPCEDWPDYFVPGEESPLEGTWYCPKCRSGMPVENCSNEDTRTTGESDRTSDERMKGNENG